MNLTSSSQQPEKQLNKEAFGCGKNRALASETRGLLPRACVTYRALNLGFPFSTKGPLIPPSQHCILLDLTIV